MLAKTKDPFISLKDKKDMPTVAEMPGKEPTPRGPTLYISDIDLPITDADLDQSLTAEIKITPRRISSSSDGDSKTKSFELEVTAIRFTG